jgi:hypothetical protein
MKSGGQIHEQMSQTPVVWWYRKANCGTRYNMKNYETQLELSFSHSCYKPEGHS